MLARVVPTLAILVGLALSLYFGLRPFRMSWKAIAGNALKFSAKFACSCGPILTAEAAIARAAAAAPNDTSQSPAESSPEVLPIQFRWCKPSLLVRDILGALLESLRASALKGLIYAHHYSRKLVGASPWTRSACLGATRSGLLTAHTATNPDAFEASSLSVTPAEQPARRAAQFVSSCEHALDNLPSVVPVRFSSAESDYLTLPSLSLVDSILLIASVSAIAVMCVILAGCVRAFYGQCKNWWRQLVDGRTARHVGASRGGISPRFSAIHAGNLSATESQWGSSGLIYTAAIVTTMGENALKEIASAATSLPPRDADALHTRRDATEAAPAMEPGPAAQPTQNVKESSAHSSCPKDLSVSDTAPAYASLSISTSQVRSAAMEFLAVLSSNLDRYTDMMFECNRQMITPPLSRGSRTAYIVGACDLLEQTLAVAATVREAETRMDCLTPLRESFSDAFADLRMQAEHLTTRAKGLYAHFDAGERLLNCARHVVANPGRRNSINYRNKLRIQSARLYEYLTCKKLPMSFNTTEWEDLEFLDTELLPVE